MNKRSMFAVLMVLALMALPVAVFAQEEAERVGVGSITAQGDGRAVVKGVGSVEVSGNGKLVIVDRGGDAQINVTGYENVVEVRINDVARKFVYTGFTGEATVSGSLIKVKVAGTGIDLFAEGTGEAHLQGQGTWTRTNSQGERISGEWFSCKNWVTME